MFNVDNCILELKKYFKKLSNSLTSEAVFSFGKTKYVNKTRIDDLLCCIEATMPVEYKKYNQGYGNKKLKSTQAWAELNTAIKNKFFLSNDIYAVDFSAAIGSIQVIQKTIEADLRHVFSNEA